MRGERREGREKGVRREKSEEIGERREGREKSEEREERGERSSPSPNLLVR